MDHVEAAELAGLAKRLRREVESLSDHPALAGFSAWTPKRTAYVTIVNGVVKSQPQTFAPRNTALVMCAATVAEALKLRDQVGGRNSTYLVWRAWPEFDAEGNLYTRLCFEKLDKAPAPKPGADIVEV